MGKKCAAVNCRSGYKPKNEEKALIRIGVDPPTKKHVFSFPKHLELRGRWIAATRRLDDLNLDCSGVCELHFRPEDFEVDLSPRTGTERQRRRLRNDAVPSIFETYPETAKSPVQERPTRLATPSARRSHQEQALNNLTEAFFERNKISDLDDLDNKLAMEMLPSGFRPVMMEHRGEKLLSIRTEDVDEATGLPFIINNISIYSNLNYNMHSNGVQLPNRMTADITKSGQFSTVGEVVNVLARVKSLTAGNQDRLEAAAQMLDALTDTSDDDIRLMATFAAEQLRLVAKPPRSRRYSPLLLGNAVVWDRTSPKLYQMMHKSAIFCLPHSRTLRRLTSALHVNAGLDSGTMAYLGMRVEMLEPRERIVNLAMDEVYTSQCVELAGGRLYGETTGVVTKTLFCTHINSVAGKYEDMISMLPVPHVTAVDIQETFQKVLQGLTELGFKVVSVTTDNHRTNQSWHNRLGADGRHPEYIINPYSEHEERVYTLYDTVHIFKNIYYGLMRARTLTLPAFPGLEDPRQLKVSFSHLTRLHNIERGHPGKLAYKLTDKVLRPSVLERVNVGLAAAATHETTCAALRHFAERRQDCTDFADTAEFLELVRRWFNACNVKSKFMSRRLCDQNRVELRHGCEASERSLNFIRCFGIYMRNLQEKGSAMTRDTCMAVFYSSRGLVSLTQYLLSRYAGTLDYVLLGKIQSDKIEGHFGHLRKLSGGNYWSSVRQFLENEAVIRTKGLIWWSGFTTAEISSRMAPSRQKRQQEDLLVVEELVAAVASDAEPEELENCTKAALGHIAGYLARSATKGNKCGACADLLIDQEAAPLSVRLEEDCKQVESIFRSFTELLDRGKLLVPSSTAIDITMKICQIWRKLVKEEARRRQLLGCSLPRKAFMEVVNTVVNLEAELTGTTCNEGHSVVNNLVRQMSAALFNLFAGNMVRDINSEVHCKRKPGAVTDGDKMSRSRNDDKRRKLTGVKKM